MKTLTYIKKENLNTFLEKLNKNYDVFLPVQNKADGTINFESLDIVNDNNVINLKEKTRKSPKSLFFPPSENLFEFEYKKDIKKPDIMEIKLLESEKMIPDEINSRKKVIFGIKPCDTMAVKCLDLVFGEGEKKDPYYIMKRKNTILISIGCSNVFPDCFCTSVGGNPFYFDYSDLGLIDMGQNLVIFKLSERDDLRKLLDECNEFFEEREINSDEEIEIKKIISESEKKCSSNWESVNAEDIALDMERKFSEEEMWKNITRKCISCAACTYVCPTCVCFNIGDEQTGMKGERYRCWDFCTNYYYTLEASGHNPREKIYQRYRNKINCKYNYFYKRNKNLYCVGCGRCIDVCPVGMDIREIVKHVRSLQK